MKTRQTHAFTLVELLVVIGIIGLLISILIPALARAKESSRQVKCMSNMRQLAQATVQYANDSKGTMPSAAGGSIALHVPGDPSKGTYDFIMFHRQRDPITNRPTGVTYDWKITDSALARYLSRDEGTLDQIFRCPSDNLAFRPNLDITKPFRYSYSMNRYVATAGATPKRIGSIKDPANKVMYVCEDENTLDDGYYNPQPGAWDTGRINGVAARHRIKMVNTRSISNMSGVNVDTLGNVAFVDGHAAIFGRKEALRKKHTDNPLDDPPGF